MSRVPIVTAAIALAPAIIALFTIASSRATSAEPAAADQCIACHTDAATLRSLTPPDPPPAEAGEG